MKQAIMAAVLVLSTPVLSAGAERCSATPEDAARALVGGGVVNAVDRRSVGYRAQDLVIDPVLKRVWARILDCSRLEAPALLVPIGNDPAQMAQHEAIPSSLPASTAVVARRAAVHPGDAIEVTLITQSMHMTVYATAEAQGAIGDSVPVTIHIAGQEEGTPKRLSALVVGPGKAEILQ